MMANLSRRKLFIAVAAAGLVSLVPFRWKPSTGAEPLAKLKSALSDACRSEAVARDLGRTCVMQNHPEFLARNAAELAASFDRANESGMSFADWFRFETTSDFDAGRVVRVDGWVISETEFLLFRNFAA